MAAYAMDLRERVVAACDEGIDTRAEIAARFSVREFWVRRWLPRRRDSGSIAPKPRGGSRTPAFSGEAAEWLRRAVAADPDATRKELAAASGVAYGWGSRATKVAAGRRAGPARPEGRAPGVAGGSSPRPTPPG